MDNKARLMGYGLAVSLLAGALGLLGLLREDLLRPHYYVKVGFPQIGTLMQDDPVELKGVVIGRVARIKAENGSPGAVLELYRRNFIPEDSRFLNYSYSLFGARMVILLPGVSDRPLNPALVQRGEFSNGLAETIHRVDGLLTAVVQYRELSGRLRGGENGSPSLQALLADRIYPAVKNIERLAEDLDQLQGRVESELRGMDRVGSKLEAFASEAGPRADALLGKAGQTLTQLDRLCAQSASLLKELDQMVKSVGDSAHAMGQLVERRAFYDQTLSLSRNLRTLISLLEKDGVSIIRWKNVHLLKNRPPE